MVQSYGADYVVDYHSATAISDLQSRARANESTMGPLTLCLDCISTEPTARFCAKVLDRAHSNDDDVGGDAKKMYSAIAPFTPELPGITTVVTLGYSFRQMIRQLWRGLCEG